MTAPTITELPDAPSPYDNKKDFNTKAFAFTSALPTMVGEINELSEYFNSNVNLQQIQTYTATSIDIDTAQTGKWIITSNASAKTLNVIPESSLAQPDGATYLITNTGAGDLTISAGSGVTITNNAAVSQNGSVILKRVSEDSWFVIAYGGTSGGGGGSSFNNDNLLVNWAPSDFTGDFTVTENGGTVPTSGTSTLTVPSSKRISGDFSSSDILVIDFACTAGSIITPGTDNIICSITFADYDGEGPPGVCNGLTGFIPGEPGDAGKILVYLIDGGLSTGDVNINIFQENGEFGFSITRIYKL